MIISNSGKMRRLKMQIKLALQVESMFDFIEGAVDSTRCTLDIFKEMLETQPKTISENIKIFEIGRETILENPYLKSVSIKEEHSGKMVYSNKRRIRSKILSQFSESERDLDTYLLKKEFWFPDKVIDLPILYEADKNVAWMTVEPYEINTLNGFIEKASGNVLICGCGLGYTSFMVALKDNVDNITILEKNEDVINLFKNQVLPNITNSDKINIIKCDANEYLNNTDLSVYDCINIDIWYDLFDMIYPYLKSLILEEKFPNTNFTYWIEQSLLNEIQRELLSYIVTGKYIEKIPQLTIVAKGIISISDELINSKEALNEFISFANIRKKLLEWTKINMDIVEELGSRIEESEEEITSTITKYLKGEIPLINNNHNNIKLH